MQNNVSAQEFIDTSICAIIPVAGYSSRMGFFKPLQPLGSGLVIEQTIKLFQNAGILDIRAVVGHKAELITPILDKLGVRAILNPDYEKGMYSSIQSAVRTLGPETQAFFLLPGDSPLVKEETIAKLICAYHETPDTDVIYPVYKGEKGHPPLISKSCFGAIIDSQPREGLKEVLDNQVYRASNISVEDPGILFDLDTYEDYQKAVLMDTPRSNDRFPSMKECLELLTARQGGTSAFYHCQQVARVASCLAENLNSKGCRLNLGQVMAGGLLHDLAKGEEDHAGYGKKIIADWGYDTVAEIVGTHMQIHFDSPKPTEAAIVYYADKIVHEDHVVSLEDRMAYAKERYKAFTFQDIEERFEEARKIERAIEIVIGKRVKELFRDKFWGDGFHG